MRQLLGLAIFFALALPLTADEKEVAVKKFNGTYKVLSVVIDGKPDDEKKDKATLIFKDGTITVKEAGDKDEDNAKFTVDPSKKPAHIDITPDFGPKEPLLGIYEFKETDEGTELSIALGKEKTERPKDFKGAGKDVMVMKLLRKKEKP